MKELRRGCLGIVLALMILPFVFYLMYTNPPLFYGCIAVILLIVLIQTIWKKK